MRWLPSNKKGRLQKNECLGPGCLSGFLTSTSASVHGFTGKIKIIAAIEDPKLIKQILEHLSLPWAAPRLMQACGPPQAEPSDFFTQEFFEY